MNDTHSVDQLTARLDRGLGVALVTPFDPDGALDEAALARITQQVVDGGADFVVALGSTGEAAMLDDDERRRVVEVVRQHRGAAALVVGAGQPGTAATIAATIAARQAGADAVLVAVPPYTKPTQAGIVAHFRALADAAADVPVIAYNVPSRSGVGMHADTVDQLWRLPNVVALKESSGDIAQIARIAARLPAGKLLLAGDDALTLPTIAVGGHGVVSVAGNVVPVAMRELVDAARAGELAAARARSCELMPLFDALCREPNPVPIKAALALTGTAWSAPRLPLLPASDETRAALKTALQRTRTLSNA
ncbi:MAG: 4-hydroxy-tetrahydrodipicolinate synthase [Planctomycetes bacterium]|nr:4-hydroxy-tetrahydrodipicolinate synthase [Planctomycetota bacterium]